METTSQRACFTPGRCLSAEDMIGFCQGKSIPFAWCFLVFCIARGALAPGKCQGKSWCPGFPQVERGKCVGRLSTRHLPGGIRCPGRPPLPGPVFEVPGPMSQSAKICDYVLTSMEVIFPTEQSVLCHLGISYVSRIPPRNQQNTR